MIPQKTAIQIWAVAKNLAIGSQIKFRVVTIRGRRNWVREFRFVNCLLLSIRALCSKVYAFLIVE